MGNATYPTAELTRLVTTDEDGQVTHTFENKLGRTLLQRQLIPLLGGGTQRLDTYTVYDDLGRVRYLIPPGAVEKAAAKSWNLQNTDFINHWLC